MAIYNNGNHRCSGGYDDNRRGKIQEEALRHFNEQGWKAPREEDFQRAQEEDSKGHVKEEELCSHF